MKRSNLRVIFSALTALTLAQVQPGFAAGESSAKETGNEAAASNAAAAPLPSAPKEKPWWKSAVVYEIYPRSFADSNNSGMGDLKGITQHLDYLKSLGVDALWLTPCYPSPQVDFGYDISDYEAIAPEYGTMEDFDELVAEAKKRNIRIVMDLVLNHTSDKCKWFEESRSSKTNAKRDWYIWRDGKSADQPPNNWLSCFGHSAWKYDPKTKQYYYHCFYPEQPDLNWRNPEVRKAMYDVVRFWLDKGVAGFRLDAIARLFEDEKLRDNPLLPGKDKYGDRNQEPKYTDFDPQVHDVLRELHKVMSSCPGDRVLIGETFGRDVPELSRMYGKDLDEIQLPMNFFFADINKLSAEQFRKEIGAWDNNPAHGWPVYVFSNHDQTRHYVRYGDGKHNDEIAKLTATILLTLRGTPLLYYGEELGMENKDPQKVEDVQDPIGKIGWPKEKGRDGERTPMQWTKGENAGFSKHKTWLPITDSYKTHNVETESENPNSILSFYRALIKLRRTEPGLKNGSYQALNEKDKDVLSYLRKDGESSVLVAVNMSAEPKTVSFDLSKFGIKETIATTLLTAPKGSGESQTFELKSVALEPFGVFVGRVK